nr:hypothetical protein [Thermosediminibacter oceani]
MKKIIILLMAILLTACSGNTSFNPAKNETVYLINESGRTVQ